jgi:SAM-dependent methyltransferase
VESKKEYSKQGSDFSFYGNSEALVDQQEGLANYNRSIVKEFLKYFGFSTEINQIPPGNDFEYCDYGAGTGSLALIFQSILGKSPQCVEIDQILIGKLKILGYTTLLTLNDSSTKFDAIYSSNVLEHIEDDNSALVQIRQNLKSGGKIALYVPALPILFSDLDRKAGHFRRYRKRDLIRKVEEAGFKVENCFYNDSIGVAASLAIKLFGYRNFSGLGNSRSLLFYDQVVFPLSKLFDRLGLKLVIGKNLYLFAISTASDTD